MKLFRVNLMLMLTLLAPISNLSAKNEPESEERVPLLENFPATELIINGAIVTFMAVEAHL